MPPVAAAIGAVGGWVSAAWAGIGTAIGGAAFGAGVVWKAIGVFALNLAVTVGVGAAMRAFSPKPKAGTPSSINQGRELAVKFDPAYPREIMVGRTAVGGSLVYATVAGANNTFLYRVICLSDVRIDAIEEIWTDGEKLTFVGNWHNEYARCTSHFTTKDNARPLLHVRIYLGTDTQTADPTLVAASGGEWDSSCRGRGIAYAIVRKDWDDEAWQGGEPNLFFVGRGAWCYDPRTGISAWSDNAALIAGQFLRGFYNNFVRIVGVGASASDVPSPELSDAADICDEPRAIPLEGWSRQMQILSDTKIPENL